ncbi:MAG: Ig-like domain-containing protein [bacterium]
MLKGKTIYNKLIKTLLIFILSGYIFCFVKIVFAQEAPVWGENNEASIALEEETGLTKTDPRIIIVNIIRIFLGFLGVILVILVMYAGFLWMTAGGDENKITQSKTILKNSLIGLLIILSSYAIVSFVLRMLGSDNGEVRLAGEPVPSAYSYLGAANDHIIESHYPAREQKDVPKNTNIVITFREEMDINSIIDTKRTADVCGTTGNEKCINFSNIRIFKTSDGDGCINDDTCVSNVLDVTASSINNKIFVFNPAEHLNGSEEGEEYTVYLANGLKKKNGDSAFSAVDNYQWTFFVSNNLDLTPPMVASIFPFPDNGKDVEGISTEGIKAEWELVVNAMPLFKRDAIIGTAEKQEQQDTENIAWAVDSNAKISGTYNSAENAEFIITIYSENNNLKANIKLNNKYLADKTIVDNKLEDFFPGLTFERENMVAGNSWKINIDGKVEGNFITINNTKYIFGEDIKKDNNETLTSLSAKIAAMVNQKQSYEINARVDDTTNNKIILTAFMASQIANGWEMESSSQSISLTVKTSGADKNTGADIQKGGRLDWPINAVIQINFNEAIDPVSANYFIKIFEINNANESKIAGEFLFSNQYKTMEFKPANPCGFNSCGEAIFCLPEEKKLKIIIKAGELAANCADDGGCASRDNFLSCTTTGNTINLCQDSAGKNYPEAKFNSGVMDMCSNSLDGNKNEKAEGPGNGNTVNQSGKDYFNENDLMAICADGTKEIICSNDNKSNCDDTTNGCKYSDTAAVKDATERIAQMQQTQGDDYGWSFYTGDEMETGAPNIISRTPNQSSAGLDKSTPVTAEFDKLMMSSSLRSGAVDIIDKENVKTSHNCVNLNPKMIEISASKQEASASYVSYWVEKKDEDQEPDGYPDNTEAIIKHGDFDLESVYEGDIGSGVKDIYQNCYNPSSGPCPWTSTTLCRGCYSGVCDCSVTDCTSGKCEKCADSDEKCCVE